LDHDLFVTSAGESILMIRNHPSIALYVGGNEEVPPSDLNIALGELVMTFDPQRFCFYLPIDE
jgi:beta-galactosidase/beta-glucuronidase